MNKVLIIGRLPKNSGIGGVTIHVSRLLKLFDEFDFSYEFIDIKDNFLFLKFIAKVYKTKKIYLHASSPYLRFLITLFCFVFSKKIILMIHGDLGRFNSFKNFFDFLAIRMCSKPLLINEISFEKAISLNKNSRLVSAYIPPIYTIPLEKDVTNLIENARQNSKLIVVTNASCLAFDKFGNEIYGISDLLRFFGSIDNTLLIIVDPKGENKKYITRSYPSLLNNGYFITEKIDFYELLKISDSFIRNTSTDGDSLSVREAIELNIDCYTTDVVSRPDGAIVYSTLKDLKFDTKKSNSTNEIGLETYFENQIENLKI